MTELTAVNELTFVLADDPRSHGGWEGLRAAGVTDAVAILTLFFRAAPVLSVFWSCSLAT